MSFIPDSYWVNLINTCDIMTLEDLNEFIRLSNEKRICVRNNSYEEAASLRDKQKQLLDKYGLPDLKIEIIISMIRNKKIEQILNDE